ncbi:MAG: Hsp20/alpha crystallin family protein [Chitinophagales bacterium]|nr:Hsp20/alpha crystallin family protein [Chitinophagales bacterium]
MFNKGAFKARNGQQGFDNNYGGCKGGFGGMFGEGFGRSHGGHHPWADKLRRHMAGHKAVNIEETEDAYMLSLYAAGLKKEQFNISIDEEVLTIGYQPKNDEGKKEFIYEEYQPTAFERSFRLNGKVLTDKISATYTDGVLTVTLPKDPEAQEAVQEIKVA